jgi:hypothetical protein
MVQSSWPVTPQLLVTPWGIHNGAMTSLPWNIYIYIYFLEYIILGVGFMGVAKSWMKDPILQNDGA